MSSSKNTTKKSTGSTGSFTLKLGETISIGCCVIIALCGLIYLVMRTTGGRHVGSSGFHHQASAHSYQHHRNTLSHHHHPQHHGPSVHHHSNTLARHHHHNPDSFVEDHAAAHYHHKLQSVDTSDSLSSISPDTVSDAVTDTPSPDTAAVNVSDASPVSSDLSTDTI